MQKEAEVQSSPSNGGSDRTGFMGALEGIVTSKYTERIIITLLIINAITLGMETSKTIMNSIGWYIHALDKAILTVFVVEIALRFIVKGRRFVTDGWDMFDFTIIMIALIPSSGQFQVLRSLRILRTLRLASTVPQMRRVVSGLINAIPGMGSIILLLLMIFYIAAVMSTGLFGEKFPEFFGTIGASFYSLFQIMTLESWSEGLVRPVMKVYPYAWAFFVPFILITSFTVLNLFIGIIVSSMQKDYEDEAQKDRDELAKESHQIIAEVGAVKSELAALREELKGALEAKKSD